MDQVKKIWTRVDTYGGKLVENIVQAIARDILADSLKKLDKAGYDIVMHVHDEAVAEIPKFEAEKNLEQMCAIMGEPISWAEGLPLGADGYITDYYKKD
jgi:DNA polymerase